MGNFYDKFCKRGPFVVQFSGIESFTENYVHAYRLNKIVCEITFYKDYANQKKENFTIRAFIKVLDVYLYFTI